MGTLISRRTHQQFVTAMSRIFAVTAIAIAFAIPSVAASEKVYSFQDSPDGAVASAGVTFGPDGALYGTTLFGGSGPCPGGCGTVFRLTKTRAGVTETVIHTFQGELADGQTPTSSVAFDAAGNLYGTAEGGMHGCGIVYELSPAKSGQWTESILHNFDTFNGSDDGCINDGNFSPTGALIFDKSGNLYGTTIQGGGGDTNFFCSNGCGTVFQMTRQGDGTWRETVIHSFPHSGASSDGSNPQVGVLMDTAGNLYGTTFLGGEAGSGVVYQLQAAGNNTWKENILFTFTGDSTGFYPYGELVLDNSGNLYGTTSAGGNCNSCAGTVYRLTPQGQGAWKETVVHFFGLANPSDGVFPQGLLKDNHGNLYGSTQFGGGSGGNCSNIGCGSVYELSRGANGEVTEKILFSFDEGVDGGLPYNNRLVMDKAGNLYGTTLYGGLSDLGVVFEVTP